MADTPQGTSIPLSDDPTHDNQTAIALIAAGVTVLLVLIVMLLMAFIEYQSRLLRNQPGIRTSEIMDSVSRELGIEDEFAKQQGISQGLREATEKLRLAQGQVTFRIERVCSLFAAADAARITRCQQFLARLPYDGTLDAAPGEEPSTEAREASRALPTGERWSAFNEAVLSSFIREMENDEKGQERIARYLPVLSDDIVQIARLNQEIHTTLSFKFEQEREAYVTSCLRSALLSAGITYQDALPQCGLSQPIAAGGNAGAAGAGKVPGKDGAPPAPSATPPQVGTGAAGPVPEGEKISIDPNLMDKQKRFDLVRQFRIYNALSLGFAKPLLLSPPDYLATWLLFFGGALGSMLKILFWHITPVRENRWSYLLVEPAQGLVCAILLFILFRSGVVVISGAGVQTTESSPLSPYFVAFMAIGAGLLSDQVLQAFRNAARSVIGDGALRQPSRWAVWLQEAIDGSARAGCTLTPQQIASRIGVDVPRLESWLALQSATQPEYQERLSILLGVPGYRMFTDIDPNKVRRPDADGTPAAETTPDAAAPVPAGAVAPPDDEENGPVPAPR